MGKKSVAKKVDKRTLYTKSVIKDALLQLMEKKAFDKITITDVCKEAEINRGTYYLHYYELTEVLDELLEDAFSNIKSFPGKLDIPEKYANTQCPNFTLCQIIRHSQKYKVLLLDDSLTCRIIDKLAAIYKADFVAETMECYKVDANQAEAIFYFQINGCFAISKSGYHLDCDDWFKIRQVIDDFIQGGLNQLLSADN